jgi:hypothetical protein
MKYGRVVDIPTIRRFLSKVQVVGDSDCWNWTACRTRKGYGRFHIAGQTRWAHRISYAIFVGDIPDELTVDHMCFNPSCCRPDHLRLVSPNQNSSHKQSREAGDDSDEILI